MSSAADRALVASDPGIPGLGTLLDAGALREVLTASLTRMGLGSVREAGSDYLRYKPGENCLAAYRAVGGGLDVRGHLKAYRLGDEAKARNADRRSGRPGSVSTRHWLMDRLVEICVLPVDDALPALEGLFDRERRTAFLRRRFPGLSGGETRLDTLAYKPGRRWVGVLSGPDGCRAVLKVHGADRFEAVRRAGEGISDGETLRLAPRLGASRRRRLLVTGWVDGRTLRGVRELDGLTRVGRALAELHQGVALEGAAGGHLRMGWRLGAVSRELCRILPDEAVRVRRVVERLEQWLSGLGDAGLERVHGDLHAGQVLLGADGRVTFLDLDESGPGDPAWDLGNFLAHWEAEEGTDRLGDVASRLRSGYGAAGGEADPDRVRGWQALGRFLLLPHAFRGRLPAWDARMRAGLDRVEALVVGRGKAVDGPCSRGADTDPALPTLGAALDAVEMRRVLPSVLEGTVDCGVEAIRLRRHKAGRRALVAYDVEVRRADGLCRRVALLGKIRRRGVDRVNLEALRQLLERGFGDGAMDGIGIPAVMGEAPELRMWFQERIDADDVTGQLAGPGGVRVAARSADAIRKLHRSDVDPGRRHRMEDELERLRQLLREAAVERPDWRRRLEELGRGCREAADRMGARDDCVIHRDYYPDQVLHRGGRVWLVDLDLLALGNPLLDAGNFVAHLIEAALRTPAKRPDLESASRAFARRFLEGGDARSGELSAAVLVSLARHVRLSQTLPGRATSTEAVLEFCEALAGGGGGGGFF